MPWDSDPGLVGGHCIGIDPYYFTYEAEKLGYHSQIILAGRKVNDDMGDFVADAIIKQLVRAGKAPKDARIVIMGLTFKENCPDIRNTKVVDIIAGLADYGVVPTVVDPWADKEEARRFYNVDLMVLRRFRPTAWSLLLLMNNSNRSLLKEWDALFSQAVPVEQRVVIDVKGLINPNEAAALGWSLWRL